MSSSGVKRYHYPAGSYSIDCFGILLVFHLCMGFSHFISNICTKLQFVQMPVISCSNFHVMNGLVNDTPSSGSVSDAAE
jgi:hypothetical protein